MVPSDCKYANLPAVAARIAVPAVAEPSGTTLLDAEITEFAVMFFSTRIRPVKEDAVGKVTVLLVVVKINECDVINTVYVAELTVIGAFAPNAFTVVHSLLIVVLPVAPATAEPMLMVVVEPETPAVPKLIVLVLPDAVAPAWMFVV